MYTYFYVCTWCNVHMCIVSASVIHIGIWGKISGTLCMYMLCMCICVIHTCMWRPVQDTGFFFPLLISSCCAMAASVTQPEGEHLCWPSRVHMSHPYPLPVLGLHAHAAMLSFLYDCCPYPYTGNTFPQWDIPIPPYVCTVFNAQQRANKLSHSCPQAFWYRNRSLGDWNC